MTVKIRRASPIVLPLLAVVLLVPSISGFETIGVQWLNRRASYRIHPNFPPLAGTSDEQIAILRCAADSWRDQSTVDFEFNYAGTTNTPVASLDGQNVVLYSSEDDNEALAVTLISGIANRFTEFDMIFFASTDGEPNLWQGVGEPEGDNYDLRGTAVHEFGHAMGLDHSTDFEATMYFAIRNQGLTLRTLDQDDRDGAVFLYGERSGAVLAPIVQNFWPVVGSVFGGDTMTFDGVNFTWPTDTTIEIGGTPVTGQEIVEHSCTRMVVPQLPPGSPGVVDIVIRNEIGTTVLEDAFEYRVNPSIVSVEPNRGPTEGGLPLRITGENFSPDGSILIAGLPLIDPRFISSTVFEGVLPGSGLGGEVDVEYLAGSETAQLSDGFTYYDITLRIVDTEVPVDPSVALSYFVDLSLTSDEDLESLNVALSFDPAVLEVTGISTVGTISENAALQDAFIDGETGQFTVLIDTQGGFPIASGADQTLLRVVVQHAVDSVPGQSSAIAFIPNGLVPAAVSGGDTEDALGFAGTVTLTFPPSFVRGDTNDDGLLTVGDPLGLLFYLFAGITLLCPDAADFDDNGTLVVADAILSLEFQFLGGPAPAVPYPTTGLDSTPDILGCRD